jgi:glycine oxidase
MAPCETRLVGQKVGSIMCDVLIVGGGVIGLSAAWELAQQGLSVELLEQGQIGQEASWAGAGMLPPGNTAWATTREARLRGASYTLWPSWADKLQNLSGAHTGYLRCGSLQLAATETDPYFTAELSRWKSEQVQVELLNAGELRERFPGVSPTWSAGYFLPDYAQVRNPWLLKALQTACARAGVTLRPGHPVIGLESNGRRLHTVRTPSGAFSAGQFLFTAGAWSGELARQLGVSLPVTPVRGQIVLLEARPAPINSILEVGPRYIVPRQDGRLLVGSTEERVGFDKRTTAGATADLLQFAQQLLPVLAQARFERAWAGLRPHLPNSVPFIGRVPVLDNVCLATGHFRSGLQMSPITAVMLRQLVLGETCELPPDDTHAWSLKATASH